MSCLNDKAECFPRRLDWTHKNAWVPSHRPPGLRHRTEPVPGCCTDATNPRLEPMLRSQGVNYRAIIDRAGPICLRRIFIEERSGLFEIDDELGEPAFVMAVHAVDVETVIDLIAWPVMRPEAFGSYFRYAGLLGGDAVVNPASFTEAPCPIWATPLAWLRGDLHGCVVLDPSMAAPILRSGSRPVPSRRLFCEDPHSLLRP